MHTYAITIGDTTTTHTANMVGDAVLEWASHWGIRRFRNLSTRMRHGNEEITEQNYRSMKLMRNAT